MKGDISYLWLDGIANQIIVAPWDLQIAKKPFEKYPSWL